ncbi:MAG: ScyD/ScyE family protein [Iphinoe sp. HA4291-MV1]|nr:ScyD/ScyE family protein [Iphinoe sp. HA4291-MV1]
MSVGIAPAVQAATFNIEVLANGLDSPRGLTFGSDGALYVTEAGRGGGGACIPSPSQPGAELCYGATSALTRIKDGKSERIVTGLPSLALPDGSDASGAHDIAFDSTGKPYILFGLAGNPRDRENLLGIPDFGQLFAFDKLNTDAARRPIADLAAYEGANNPDGGDVISNPYAFLIKDNTAFIVDAGANDLLRVGLDGSGLAVQSVFSTRLVPNPSGGADIPMQPVPTSVAIGPDNAFYVGQLTGVPFPKDGARIYRIDSNNQPEIYADGFTNIIDLAFDSTGNLYVLEYAANSILSGDTTGALIRIAPNGTRTTIASSELISPTALALGSDGAIYISNNGFNAGKGQILRLVSQDNSISVSESNPTSSLLIFATCAMLSLLRYKQKLTT